MTWLNEISGGRPKRSRQPRSSALAHCSSVPLTSSGHCIEGAHEFMTGRVWSTPSVIFLAIPTLIELPLTVPISSISDRAASRSVGPLSSTDSTPCSSTVPTYFGPRPRCFCKSSFRYEVVRFSSTRFMYSKNVLRLVASTDGWHELSWRRPNGIPSLQQAACLLAL